MPDNQIVFKDEWVASDPQVRQLIEAITGKPFPDPEKYYLVTNIARSCTLCGRLTTKCRVDPYEETVCDYPVIRTWICDACYRDRWMDS